jgi:hypothetical protein
MTTNNNQIYINGVPFYNENEPVVPFKGMTAAKAAALVSKEVG